MMRSKVLLVAGILLSTLLLTACSSTAGGSKSAPAQPQSDAIKTGAQAMRTELAGLQKAIEAGDAAKAKAGADALEAAWQKFEDDVKAKDKTTYGNIEDPLGAIEAGVKATPLDKATLADQVKKLDALLADLTK